MDKNLIHQSKLFIHGWNVCLSCFGGENWKKLQVPEPTVAKLSFETIIHIEKLDTLEPVLFEKIHLGNFRFFQYLLAGIVLSKPLCQPR